eukprot:365577-Chlamydomonas_euryale.AAC.2
MVTGCHFVRRVDDKVGAVMPGQLVGASGKCNSSSRPAFGAATLRSKPQRACVVGVGGGERYGGGVMSFGPAMPDQSRSRHAWLARGGRAGRALTG